VSVANLHNGLEQTMTNNKLQQAITNLALLKEGWSLLADTDGSVFLDEVRKEIEQLRNQAKDRAEFEEVERKEKPHD
jgi:hypothetical protein